MTPSVNMQALTPIKETTEEYEKIEKAITAVFKREIYLPLVRELGGTRKTLQNSNDDLLQAIKSGRIQYGRGSFTGKFNASVSRALKDLGATWDRKSKSFKIHQAFLPIEVRQTISSSLAKFEQTISDIDQRLAEIVPEAIADKLQISGLFEKTLWKVESEFQKSVRNITVAPKLSSHAKSRLASEWQSNMDIWIKDFTKKEIGELRSKIRENVMAGHRQEGIISTVTKSYNVTENKARFLARQETALMISKFKESRYVEAGVYWYKWRCVAGSRNHPVRHSHKILEGKSFRWDNPPITTEAGEPVRRNNPGQDYNCRCFAIPLVKRGGDK